MDNNTDRKNPYAKAGFSTYKTVSANTDIDAGDMTNMGDTGGTGSADNNTDSKNIYANTGFSTYNIAVVNANAGISADDINGMGEKVSNNINNTSEGQFGRVDETNKGKVDRIIKGGVGETNIKVMIGVGEANKSRMGGANKAGMSEANIKVGKKAGVEAIVSIENSTNSGNKVTD